MEFLRQIISNPLAYHTVVAFAIVLVFSLLSRAVDSRARWGAESALREQAYRRFTAEGIEIPVPRRVVYMEADA